MKWLTANCPARVWAITLFLILLAAIPRMIRPGLAEYKLDESTAVLAAFTAIQQHTIPLHGQGSSVPGASQGPLLYDLLVLVLAIRPDPRVAVATIGLLNALAVGLAYRALRRPFGERVAFFAAVLFAGGSWAIVFSRKIWPNDLLAPLSVVALWGLLRAIDPKTVVPSLGRAWVAVAGLVSLNFGAWSAVLAPTLVQMLVPRTRQGPASRWSLAGLAFFLATLVPRLPDMRAILSHLLAPARASNMLDLTPLSFVVQLAGPDAFQVLAGPAGDFARITARTIWLGPALQGLLLFGGGVAVARLAFRWRQSTIQRMPRAIEPELVILFWWLVPALVAVPHLGIEVFIHHFLGTLPSQFVLIALGVDALAAGASRLLARFIRSPRIQVGLPSLASGAFVLAAVAIQLSIFRTYLSYVEARPVTTFFGSSLGLSLAAVRSVRDAMAGEPVYVLSEGALVGVDVTPTVFASLADGADLRYVDVDHSFLFPASGTASYIVAPASLSSLRALLAPWQVTGGPLSPFTMIGGDAGYARFQARAPGTWLPPGWHPLDAAMLDRSQITGFNAPRQIQPGRPLEVDVAWRIGQSPQDPSQQSVFAHLVGDDGHSWASDDFAPLPSVPWPQGALLINRFSLAVPSDLPPGRYWVDFGRYERPGIRPVPVVGTDGQPGPTSLRIGPLAVAPTQRFHPVLKPASVEFGNQIKLDGWWARQHGVTEKIVLQWQAIQPPSASYTVFVHLIGPDGKLVAQSDSEPRGGRFPTSTWQTGDVAFDPHQIPVAQLPPGDYRVEVGFYLAKTGQRLPVGNDTAYRLGTIHLAG